MIVASLAILRLIFHDCVDHLVEDIFHSLSKEGTGLHVLDEALEVGSLLTFLFCNFFALPNNMLNFLLRVVAEFGAGVRDAHTEVTFTAGIQSVLVVKFVTFSGDQNQRDGFETILRSDFH